MLPASLYTVKYDKSSPKSSLRFWIKPVAIMHFLRHSNPLVYFLLYLVTLHFTSVAEFVVHKMKKPRWQCYGNSDSAHCCAIFMEQNNPDENFKALMLFGSIYYMASQNSSSECFQGICHNYNRDFRKRVFHVLSCVATQTTKPFLGCVLLSQLFLGVKQKPKCKAVHVTEQEAVMTQGDQADISLLGIFP